MRAPDFWWEDRLAARLLAPLGRLYGLASGLRRHLVRPRPAAVPVICIGNLTVGGAGKTPCAIAVAERLQALGGRPHFLTRGYGGRETGPIRVDPDLHDARAVGDEPILLARTAPVWVAADRIAGAGAAVAAGANAIVMDDGLQNPYLAKDLTLLTIDGAIGFGNGRLLPAGPLREPPGPAWSRIDAAIVIGEDRSGVGELLPSSLPRLTADLVPDVESARFAGRRVLAFAGIGRPEKFFETLRKLGVELVETRSFPDHHPFTAREIEALLAETRQFDAACVTTEKDHLRLPAMHQKHIEKLPVRLRFREPGNLDRLLAACLESRAADAK